MIRDASTSKVDLRGECEVGRLFLHPYAKEVHRCVCSEVTLASTGRRYIYTMTSTLNGIDTDFRY